MSKSVRRKVRRSIISTASGGKTESQMTPMEKMERLGDGISKRDLEMLKHRTGLDYDKLAKLLSVTRPTLINKTGSGKFPPALSERILSLADIYSYGYDVFEDEARFNQWMFNPNRALGGMMPFDLCNNQFGREEVKNLIGRIDFGVYS
jgi:putative toxin-antitoxin system antitoxin component (TIGR02293 family)